jgi:hypothetical protein
MGKCLLSFVVVLGGIVVKFANSSYFALVVLEGLAIIPLSIDQRGADAACMALPWLLAIGFSLTFSAL